MSEWAARGRAEKVLRMAEATPTHIGLDGFGDAEEIARRLRGLSEHEWLALQQAAGYTRSKPPSRETRDGVIAVFERRVDIAGEQE